MRYALIIMVWTLVGCAQHLQARQGPEVPAYFPQAEDQCKAQPELAWCKERARDMQHH